MFDTAIEKPDPGGQPTLLVDGPGEAVSRRCGRIFENAHSRTRKYLFLRSIYEPTIGEGDGISSFFVRRSVFFAFFGRPPKNSLFEQQGGNPPSPDLEDVMQVDYDHATTSSDRSTSSSPKSTFWFCSHFKKPVFSKLSRIVLRLRNVLSYLTNPVLS